MTWCYVDGVWFEGERWLLALFTIVCAGSWCSVSVLVLVLGALSVFCFGRRRRRGVGSLLRLYCCALVTRA